MMIEALKSLYTRDLTRLVNEIEQYQNEESIWRTAPGIANSGGNLCLHLIGNLNTYIGGELGKTGYIRNRDLEFSSKNVPKANLVIQIKQTMQIVDAALDQLSENDMDAIYPQIVFEKEMTTGYFLIHLSSHLTYHLGQINYHRRLLDK
ncbi:DinB family protein [Mucilaginibacter sp. AW1-3]